MLSEGSPDVTMMVEEVRSGCVRSIYVPARRLLLFAGRVMKCCNDEGLEQHLSSPSDARSGIRRVLSCRYIRAPAREIPKIVTQLLLLRVDYTFKIA